MRRRMGEVNRKQNLKTVRKMSDLNKMITKVRNTHSYENLKEVLGKELGGLLYKIVDEADLVDKELDLTHKCITKLYEVDHTTAIIQKYLKKIDELRP